MQISSTIRAALLATALFLLPCLSLAQSYPPAWSAGASYAIGDQVQLNGNVLRATHAVPPGSFKYADWELWEVRSNTNVMVGVGQTFTSLQTAWTYAHNATVATGAYLRLYISTAKGAFSNTFSSALSLDEVCGPQISIVGDDASKITLNFPTSWGFSLDTGYCFGTIAHLTLKGTAGFGLLLSGSVANIDDVSISGFSVGLQAQLGATVNLGTVNISDVNYTAIQAQDNAVVNVRDFFTFNGQGSANSITALYAFMGGKIEASLSTISNCYRAAWAQAQGCIEMASSTLTSNSYAVEADTRGYVDVSSSIITLSGVDDASVSSGGMVIAAETPLSTTFVEAGFGSYIYN